MKAKITNKYLAAAALFAAEKDVRRYLNGIHVRPAPGGKPGAIITATNGHVLCTMHDAAAECDGEAIYPVPRELVAFCKKRKHLDGATEFCDGKATAKNGDGSAVTVDAAPIDGRFPDVARLIPREFDVESTVAPAVDARYLALPAAVAEILLASEVKCRGVVLVAPAVESPVAFSIEGAPEFFGLVMPLRNTVDVAVPWWFA